MILMEINPLSKIVAISEMLILIAIVAWIGWLIGRWITNTKIRDLRRSIASYEVYLSDCRKKCLELNQVESAVITKENLKVIEGIGPKIESLLQKNGIYTLDQLAKSSTGNLLSLLQNAGSSFQMHDPNSWPQQAALARDGKWEELGKLQDKLEGGKFV
jgi:hypothetical protein